MALAHRPPARFASLLDRGQQQRDKNADDRDHYKQLDESKSGLATALHRSSIGCVCGHDAG
jgi:hypothetical protein